MHSKNNENKKRLNRAISLTGFCSRRKADDFIKDGRVKVNGKKVTDLSYQVSGNELLEINGIKLFTEKFMYVLLNKPKGYITTNHDPHSRLTITALLPKRFKTLKAAGRLDKDSEGLVILSNDGDFLYKLQHPSKKVLKRYIVSFDNDSDLNDIKSVEFKLLNGVKVDREMYRVMSVKQLFNDKYTDKKQTILEIVLQEGKNRHIRKMLQFLGITVKKLKRMEIGGLLLDNLKTGCYKEISRKEAYANL